MKKLGLILLAFLSLSSFAQRLELPPKVEFLHTVDPGNGTFRTQLSLPVNVTGVLYFRVLNIKSLVNKPIQVLFTFKDDPMGIVLPATISTAAGITPELDVEFLAVEMKGQPFVKIKHRPLLCSLFGICPETVRIDIVTRDEVTGKLKFYAMTQKIKIFFYNATNANLAKDTLYTDYVACNSSMDCQTGACCFNGRCWDRNLVGQCFEDSSHHAQPIGNSCSSNYECSSLCCNSNSHTCHPLESNEKNKILCNQPPGALCIDKSWCREETVKDCKIIKTGTNPSTGAQLCELWCYDRKEHGDCVNQRCLAPIAPPVPNFDPAAPNCYYAVDPLTTIN
jgi:hypothetical protein